MSEIKIGKILKMLPHRYPILLVDRVLEITPDKGIIALKNVTINEDFFNGHFPDHPVMPGVLIIEAMAQAATIFVTHNLKDKANDKVVYFMTIEDAQFRKPVIPGDTLHLHVEKIKNRGNVWKLKGEARVNGERVANSKFSAMLIDKNKA